MTYLVRYRDRDVHFERAGGPSIEPYLAQGRFYEPDMLEYIEALKVPGTYVDIGGYVGTHALFFAMFCPATKVHTFEPVGEFADVLAQNVEANGLADRVQVHRIGLSDHEQTLETELEGKRSIIDCKRLDDLIDEPISLLKIDVEGMELAVLRGAERLLRTHRPLIFFEAHSEAQLEECASYLAQFGYERTGRVFNSSPTYEMVDRASPTAPGRLLPVETSLLAPSMWRLRPSEQLRMAWDGGELAGNARIAQGSRVHVSHDELDFEEPPGIDALTVEPGSTVFVHATGETDGTAAVAVQLFQYDEAGNHTKAHLGSLPRFIKRVELAPTTRAIRLVLRVAGTGALRIDRLSLHELSDQGAQSLRNALRRSQAQRARDKQDHERRVAGLLDEIRHLRSEYQRMSMACDEANAEVAHARDLLKSQQGHLEVTFRRLESSRGSISFRLGRATKAAVSGRRKLLEAPRRWLDTFKGRDEILEDLRETALAAAKPADRVSSEAARIAAEVLVLGTEPAARPGVAGVVSPRFAEELGASTRFRLLDPHSWRAFLELDPPAYVLVTSDGLAEGTPWARWGSPGGRDGLAMLRELTQWCHGRRLAVVYWDTLGTGRAPPRGVGFDATFSVSARTADRLGRAVEVLAPAIEPRIWNPTGVVAAAPAHPIFSGAFDRRGDAVELAALEAILVAASAAGLVVLDEHSGLQGAGAAAVRLPPALAGHARRRPDAERERAALKAAGLVIHARPFAGADFPSWQTLRGLALGAHVLTTPGDAGDRALARAVEIAGDGATAGAALERLAARPRLDAAWRRASERIFSSYSLRERLDHIARRVGVSPVAEPAPTTGLIAHLRSAGEVVALRGFLAAQTAPPAEIRLLVEPGVEADLLGEVIDPSRLVSVAADDPAAASAIDGAGATHLLCWTPATPVVADAVAELSRIAAFSGDEVLVHGDAGIVSVRRAAAAQHLATLARSLA